MTLATPTPRAYTAFSSLLGWRAATDRRGDLSCLAGPSIPEVEPMTTTHTPSAPPRADAAPDRFTPSRHLIEIIRREGADPWLAGVALAVMAYAGFVFAGGFH